MRADQGLEAADDPAAAELAAALDRPIDDEQQEALEIIELLRGRQSTSAALGIWTRQHVPLDEEWVSPLPDGVVGPLTDQAALDRWADEQTGGLIEKFPLDIGDETLLVLASALTARVRWRTPFEGYPRGGGELGVSPEDVLTLEDLEAVSDDPGPADQQSLSRTTSDLSIAAVLDDVVTRVVVEGDGDVDVHLLLGGEEPPGEVLGAGLRELSGQARVLLAADAGDRGGPGFTCARVDFDRPFGFLAVHRPSRLAVVAGWVKSPFEAG